MGVDKLDRLQGREARLLREEILKPLEGRIEGIKPAIHYRVALLLVALTMVLLPLIYLSIIGLSVYGLYLYATTADSLFEGRTGLGTLLLYLGPLVAGGILVLFMVKPLFARPPKLEKPQALDRNKQPLLFDFVEGLCRMLGIRAPREIRVDAEVNASAGFRRGIWSFFGGDLVLTIGLPLAAGLSLRQFAGVLAHEFGHFSQAAGMRLTYVIRSVNHWFHRVAVERDEWDLWLTRASEGSDLRIGVVLYLARACVWCTRLVLIGLMHVGNFISSTMLRQMEYDADRYEIELAGGEAFASTFARMTELSIWMHAAHQDLEAAWRDRRLPDDLSLLMFAQRHQVNAQALAEIQKERLEHKTHWTATHPADADRIAAAERNPRTGLFTLEHPADALFVDFSTLSQRITRAHYRALLGDDLGEANLVPAAEEVARLEREWRERSVFDRFALGQFQLLRPIHLPEEEFPQGSANAPSDPETVRALLSKIRSQLETQALAYRSGFDRFDQADDRIIASHQARLLLQAGFSLERGQFHLFRASLDGARDVLEQAQNHQAEVGPELQEFERALGSRVVIALGLLSNVDFRSQVDDGHALWHEVSRLVQEIRTQDQLAEQIDDLRFSVNAALLLASQAEDGKMDEKAYETLYKACHKVHGLLDKLAESLGQRPYPLEYGDGKGITTAAYLIPNPPEKGNIGQVLEAGRDAVDRAMSMLQRIWARLMVAAEQVETSLGFEPTAPPPDPDEKPPAG